MIYSFRTLTVDDRRSLVHTVVVVMADDARRNGYTKFPTVKIIK